MPVWGVLLTSKIFLSYTCFFTLRVLYFICPQDQRQTAQRSAGLLGTAFLPLCGLNGSRYDVKHINPNVMQDYSPALKQGAFWSIMANEKPLDRAIRMANDKGNKYQSKLAKVTAKMADKQPKLVRRERLNKGQSSFGFSLIGSIDMKPKSLVKKTETFRRTKTYNSVGVRKEERLITLADRTHLSIGLKSGNLPKWFR